MINPTAAIRPTASGPMTAGAPALGGGASFDLSLLAIGDTGTAIMPADMAAGRQVSALPGIALPVAATASPVPTAGALPVPAAAALPVPAAGDLPVPAEPTTAPMPAQGAVDPALAWLPAVNIPVPAPLDSGEVPVADTVTPPPMPVLVAAALPAVTAQASTKEDQAEPAPDQPQLTATVQRAATGKQAEPPRSTRTSPLATAMRVTTSPVALAATLPPAADAEPVVDEEADPAITALPVPAAYLPSVTPASPAMANASDTASDMPELPVEASPIKVDPHPRPARQNHRADATGPTLPDNGRPVGAGDDARPTRQEAEQAPPTILPAMVPAHPVVDVPAPATPQSPQQPADVQTRQVIGSTIVPAPAEKVSAVTTPSPVPAVPQEPLPNATIPQIRQGVTREQPLVGTRISDGAQPRPAVDAAPLDSATPANAAPTSPKPDAAAVEKPAAQDLPPLRPVRTDLRPAPAALPQSLPVFSAAPAPAGSTRTIAAAALPDSATPPVIVPQPAVPTVAPAPIPSRAADLSTPAAPADVVRTIASAGAAPIAAMPASVVQSAAPGVTMPPTPNATNPAPIEPAPVEARRPAFIREVANASLQAVALAPRAEAAPAPAAGVTAPAIQLFGTAMRAAGNRDETQAALPDAAAATLTAPTQVQQVAAPAAQTGGQTLDLTQQRWPHAMIDHIERLRDAADANDTRIRLIPDALGAIDVAVRRDGDTVHVHFTAEQAATRTLLQDAQPQLAQAAEERGVRLGQATVDLGGTGHAGPGQQQNQQQQARQAPVPARPLRAELHSTDDDDTADTGRLA